MESYKMLSSENDFRTIFFGLTDAVLRSAVFSLPENLREMAYVPITFLLLRGILLSLIRNFLLMCP